MRATNWQMTPNRGCFVESILVCEDWEGEPCERAADAVATAPKRKFDQRTLAYLCGLRERRRTGILGALGLLVLVLALVCEGQNYTFTTLAGNIGFGSGDGTGSAARFLSPTGVAVDIAGNVYVADGGNETIRKITPTGVVTTLAGVAGSGGSSDGTGSAAWFYAPSGVAVDRSGTLYVTDTVNNTIRKITPAGEVTTLAGLPGKAGSTDGIGSTARFNYPYGVAIDTSDNLYVTDSNNATVRKVTPAGVVTTVAGLAGNPGIADGTGSAARFDHPYGIAVDDAGNLYVADRLYSIIRKISPAREVTTLAGLAGSYASADGTGTAARFIFPNGVAVDRSGNVYVGDEYNQTIRKITPNGNVTTLAGLARASGSADGRGSAARFNYPTGVAVDGSGNVYVADSFNHTIRKITSAGVVTTLAGLAGSEALAGRYGSSDGTGSAARFRTPYGLALDGLGNLYIADTQNYTIRKITPDGAVTTLAGLAGTFGSADGTGTVARFTYPIGVAVDNAGNVSVADAGDNTIRRITPAGHVTTLAGMAGIYGNTDGPGSAARFIAPASVAGGTAGDIYVADSGNSTIRKITPDGLVMTLAGMPGMLGGADGTGSAARFRLPYGVAVDIAGNVYVADTGNSTIRKIAPSGEVTTLAGLAGNPGMTDGPAVVARLNQPGGLAVDGSGNVYVADTANSAIRRIDPTGMVTTLGGQGIDGYVDGPGSAARFYGPWGVTVDKRGSVYVADTHNCLIRKGTASAPELRITRVGDQVVLGWPFSSPGFILETTDTLRVTNWLPAVPQPVTLSGQNVVTNPAADSARFYRLRKE